MVRQAALIFAGALLCPGRFALAQSRTVLIVSVANARNGQPITDAEVIVPDEGRHLRTNWIGEARFPAINSGVHEVRVRRLGFATSDIPVAVEGDSAGVVFMLEEAAAALDTVRVLAMRTIVESHRLFELRKAKGLGRYLDAEDLAKEATRDFPVVAVSHFPGLMLITGRGGQWQLASRQSSCGVDTTFEEMALNGNPLGILATAQTSQTTGNGGGGGNTQAAGQTAAKGQGSCFSAHPCHVRLFLDDVPVAESDINVIKTEQLYGAEFYAMGNAPPQYRLPGAACGVMLLWTKLYNGS